MTENNDTLTRMRLANPAETAEPDELTALRATIDAEIAAPPSRRREPRLRRQPRPALVTAVALVVTLALFLPLRYVGQRDGGDATGTSLAPATTLAAPDVDPAEMRWRRVEIPGPSSVYQRFDTVVAGGPGLIASGWPNELVASFWTSPDGVDWSPATIATGSTFGWANDVTAGGPGYVAVGSDIWASVDGTTWQQAEVESLLGGELRAVTVGGPGLVAVGPFVNGRYASIYTSIDGLSWARIPEEGAPQGQLGNSEMLDIVTGGPGLIAVGHVGLIGAVWTSSDGFDWSRVPHDPDVFGDGDEGTELFSIAANEYGFVAVGRITDDNAMGIWRSTDGLSWSVVPLDPAVINEHHELMTVVSTEQGFIAGGAAQSDDAGVWFSLDGTTWTRLDTGDALGGPGYQEITDLTMFGDRLVAVGWESDSEGFSEVVWIGEPVEG